MTSPPGIMSGIDQEQLMEKLRIFKIQGTDRHGRNVLVIIGKYFPGEPFSTVLFLLFFLSMWILILWFFCDLC